MALHQRTPETQTGDRFYHEPEEADHFEVRRDLATGELTTAPPEIWPPSNGVDTGAETVYPVTAETIATLVAEISRLNEALIDAECRAIKTARTEWGVRVPGAAREVPACNGEEHARRFIRRNHPDDGTVLVRREVTDWVEVRGDDK